jgi:hypothetical protein
MALNAYQQASIEGPGSKKPKPKAAPGLTGADLELAKAERERDAGDKGGLTDAHDLYAGPDRHGTDAQFSARQARHAEQSETGNTDMQNIKNLVAALHAHVNSPRP